jgi:hypothetical protein
MKILAMEYGRCERRAEKVARGFTKNVPALGHTLGSGDAGI